MAGRKNRDLGCGEIVQNELSRHNIFLENGVHSFEELEGQLMCSTDVFSSSSSHDQTTYITRSL